MKSERSVRRSLFPADDELPTWLHTIACLFAVSLFALPLIWWGGEAIHTRHIEPINGPEIGHYFFGNIVLEGKAAVRAGWSLIVTGAAFLALGARYTRAGEESAVLRVLPWVLFGVSLLLGWRAGQPA